MYSKKMNKFISNETKETMTRLRLSHEISELEFKQKTDIVTESLLEAKCMYIMSVVFAIDGITKDDPDRSEKIRKCPELIRFLELLVKNNMSSSCIFIPFRSINEYLEQFPLTIFLFVKHNMKDCISDTQTGNVERSSDLKKSSKPICDHVVYRSNGSNKVDTYKTISEAYYRISDLSKHPIKQYICQFHESETKEYHISVRELSK